MFKGMKLGTKLMLVFLAVGIIPFAVMGFISLSNASRALSAAEFSKLMAVRDIKKRQIEAFFSERLGDVSVLSKSDTVITALTRFKTAFESEGNKTGSELWNLVEENYASWLKKYRDEYGYYDLFLISKDGNVVYTVAKESDLGANLVNGPLKDSGLARCFQKSLKGVSIEDFSPYAPSNNEPCAFVGAPVKKEGKTLGVVALQLSLKAINAIMMERKGLGRTGETYLVGPDKLMRSDSVLDPRYHSVKASFADPSKGSVDTEAVREALAGKAGRKIIIDYNGNPVLSAFTPVKIGDLTWALIAEIDKSEAFKVINELRWLMGIVGIIGIAAIIAVALLITRSITRPINRVISGLNEGSDQVASASAQVSAASQSLAEGASEQAASLEETSASLEEMASMTRQNADNTAQAKAFRKEAHQSLMTATEAMGKTVEAMAEIKSSGEETRKIVKTIDEIAFQTNLLALNAAVEAARAGEAGAGFAVVADEVRNLAMRAAEAAKNTQALIKKTVDEINKGSGLLEQTRDAFDITRSRNEKVAELIDEISAASNEQAQGIEEVNKAVTEMDKLTQQNAASAEESASASEELSAQAEEMRNYVNELIGLVGGKADAKPAGRGGAAEDAPDTGKGEGPRNKPKAIGAPGKTKAAWKEMDPEEVIPLDGKEFEDF